MEIEEGLEEEEEGIGEGLEEIGEATVAGLEAIGEGEGLGIVGGTFSCSVCAWEGVEADELVCAGVGSAETVAEGPSMADEAASAAEEEWVVLLAVGWVEGTAGEEAGSAGTTADEVGSLPVAEEGSAVRLEEGSRVRMGRIMGMVRELGQERWARRRGSLTGRREVGMAMIRGRGIEQLSSWVKYAVAVLLQSGRD